eukprot:14420081-Alexandrium_andersonii.AAC.1
MSETRSASVRSRNWGTVLRKGRLPTPTRPRAGPSRASTSDMGNWLLAAEGTAGGRAGDGRGKLAGR